MEGWNYCPDGCPVKQDMVRERNDGALCCCDWFIEHAVCNGEEIETCPNYKEHTKDGKRKTVDTVPGTWFKTETKDG